MQSYIAVRDSIQSALDVTGTALKPKVLTSALYAAVEDIGMATKNTTLLQNRNTKKNKSARPRKIHPCVFCGDKHFASDCTVVSTLSQQKAKVKDRCNICFSSKHRTVEHTMESKCPVCKEVKSHHHSICPLLFQNDHLVAGSKWGNLSVSIPTKQNTVEKKIFYAAAESGAHTTIRVCLINPVSNCVYFI